VSFLRILEFFFCTCNSSDKLDTVGDTIAVPKTLGGHSPGRAAKEASVNRRQFIGRMNFYLNFQFKWYMKEHHRTE